MLKLVNLYCFSAIFFVETQNKAWKRSWSSGDSCLVHYTRLVGSIRSAWRSHTEKPDVTWMRTYSSLSAQSHLAWGHEKNRTELLFKWGIRGGNDNSTSDREQRLWFMKEEGKSTIRSHSFPSSPFFSTFFTPLHPFAIVSLSWQWEAKPPIVGSLATKNSWCNDSYYLFNIISISLSLSCAYSHAYGLIIHIHAMF